MSHEEARLPKFFTVAALPSAEKIHHALLNEHQAKRDQKQQERKTAHAALWRRHDWISNRRALGACQNPPNGHVGGRGARPAVAATGGCLYNPNL